MSIASNSSTENIQGFLLIRPRYRCRIGRKPCIFFVDKFEAIDINTEEDLEMAEYVGRTHWHYEEID